MHDYIQEHIPRAVYMNEKLLRAPRNGIPEVYIPEQAVHAIFGRVGLRPDVPVVVYSGKGAYSGWGDGLEQTMVAYSLARFGHNNVYVLDGGLDKWKAEGWTVTKDYPRVEESDFPVTVRPEYFLELEPFRQMKDQERFLTLVTTDGGDQDAALRGADGITQKITRQWWIPLTGSVDYPDNPAGTAIRTRSADRRQV